MGDSGSHDQVAHRRRPLKRKADEIAPKPGLAPLSEMDQMALWRYQTLYRTRDKAPLDPDEQHFFVNEIRTAMGQTNAVPTVAWIRQAMDKGKKNKLVSEATDQDQVRMFYRQFAKHAAAVLGAD